MQTPIKTVRFVFLLAALTACNNGSDPPSPSPLPSGTTSAELTAALTQIAPYVVEHGLMTRTGPSDLPGDGTAATPHASGGGILLSTGLSASGGLGSFDHGADGLPDVTRYRLRLDVPAGSQSLVMSTQFLTAELGSAGVRADDTARIEYGAPGAPLTALPIAAASGVFASVDVAAKLVLDVYGATGFEVHWVVEDAEDGAVDSALRLFDVYFSALPAPGPLPPNDQFRMGTAVAPDNEFADPVNLDTGAFRRDEPLVRVPAFALPLAFALHYDSTAPPDTYPVGSRWRHSYQWSISELDGGARVRVKRGDGGADYFERLEIGGYGPESKGNYATLEPRGPDRWRYRTKARTSYEFGPGGVLLHIEDPRGNRVEFEYSDGILQRIRDLRGQFLTLTYESGRIAALDYAGQLQVGLAYENGRLAQITRADGSTRTFEYDAQDQLERVVDDAEVPIATNHYDDSGRVERQDDAYEHASTIVYEGDLRITTNREAAVEEKTFDAEAGKLVRWKNALGGVWQFSYDEAHQLVAELDPFQGAIRSEYDERGNLLRRRNPLGATTVLQYDGRDRLVAGRDPVGNVTRFERDTVGNLVARVDALGNAEQFEYDEQGRRVAWTDALGQRTEYGYTPSGDVSAIVDPAGGEWAYSFDELGRKLTETDPNGNTTRTTYDEAGRPLTVAGPHGRLAAYTYDAEGRLLTEWRVGQGETHYEYAPTGRLARLTNALGAATEYGYDGEERVSRITDPLERTTHLSYDGDGNLVQVLDAAQGEATAEYDVAGRRTALVDPGGSRTEYQLDAVGQVLAETDALGNTTAQEFDLAGRLVARTNARGQKTAYDYDAVDRLVAERRPGGVVHHAYDANGNTLVSKEAGQPAVHRTFDALNRLTSRSSGPGESVGHAYDAAGNLVRLTYPGGAEVHYAYDERNRLVRVVDWAGRETTYEYDAASQLTSARFPDGSQVDTAYDLAGRVTSIGDRASDGKLLFEAIYELDTVGNLVRERSLLPLHALPQLGSRQLTYGPANRLETWDGIQLAHDADGNLAWGVLAGVGRRFFHDADGRLVRAGNDLYRYDVDGLRVETLVADELTHYVYDTSVSPARLLEERDAEGELIARYVHGLGLLGREGAPSEGAPYHTYHYDGRGSTLALTDARGAVTDRYAYGPFGALLASEGSTPNPFRFVGREGVVDDGNGLYSMGSRYYAPELMRFLERDPAQSGDLTDTQGLNPYTYAGNNPILRIDPEGEFWNVVVGAVVGAVANVAVQMTVDAINGEWSSFETYAGVAVEGAIVGAFVGSGAGLGWLAAGSALGVAGGKLASGDFADASAGEWAFDLGFAVATAGYGSKVKPKSMSKFGKFLQSKGKRKLSGKLLAREAMRKFRSKHSALTRVDTRLFFDSDWLLGSIGVDLAENYLIGALKEGTKVHVAGLK